MSSIGVKNVFENLKQSNKEIIETIVKKSNCRIERILSNGDSSPVGFFYDQEEFEFVLLMRGRATLYFENKSPIELQEGDYLIIEPHDKHRVESTSKDAIWLCVFYK